LYSSNTAGVFNCPRKKVLYLLSIRTCSEQHNVYRCTYNTRFKFILKQFSKRLYWFVNLFHLKKIFMLGRILCGKCVVPMTSSSDIIHLPIMKRKYEFYDECCSL
jgi:hypothetical protein